MTYVDTIKGRSFPYSFITHPINSLKSRVRHCPMDLQLPMQSVHKVVISNPAHGEVFSIQHCDKVCQRLATGWWFSLGIPVSSTNKTDHHDITEILLKMALNTIILNH